MSDSRVRDGPVLVSVTRAKQTEMESLFSERVLIGKSSPTWRHVVLTEINGVGAEVMS